MKRFVFLLLLISQTFLLFAQEAKVVVTNANTSEKLAIKWYSKQLWYPNGVNIYRKEIPNGEWIKLNNLPIKKLSEVPYSALKNDSSLHVFVDIVNEVPANKLDGFLLLNCLIKSIQSPDFAKYLGIMYEDMTAEKGKTYQYRISKIIRATEIDLETSKTIVAGNSELSAPPEEIKIDPGTNKTFIKWKPEEDRYYAVNIYRSSNKNKSLIKVNHLPIMLSSYKDKDGSEKYADYFFIDDSLENNVTYFYQLKAIDFFGNESKPSQAIEVAIMDHLAPPPPVNLRKRIHKYHAEISWDIVQSDDLAGYNIYRSTNDKNYAKANSKLLSKTDTTFSETLEKSSYYYYQVASVDKSGNEALSNKLLIKIEDNTPPISPKNLNALAEPGCITLTWESNKEPDLIGYVIYRKIKEAGDKEFLLINQEYIKTSFFKDSLAKNIKNEFEYKVAAVDSALNISEFSAIAVAKMPDIIPPEKPTIINCISKETGVLIEWLPNVEQDLKGYNVFRIAEKDTAKINEKLISPLMHLFTDRSAMPSVRYYYAIVAVDQDNNQSVFSNLFPGMLIESEKESSSVNKLTVKYKKNINQIMLKWEILRGENYKGVVVYRKQEGQLFKPLSGIIDQQLYYDKEIQLGTTYYYKLKVYSTSGKSTVSEVVDIIPKD